MKDILVHMKDILVHMKEILVYMKETLAYMKEILEQAGQIMILFNQLIIQELQILIQLKPSMEKRNMKNQEYQNFSFVINLKKKVVQLNGIIKKQNNTIEQLKRSTKTTLINEQEIHIQKLNDENKRLLIVIDQLKDPKKSFLVSQKLNKKYGFGATPKKSEKQMEYKPKIEDRITEQKSLISQEKYYEIIQQNNSLRKEVFHFKANQNNLVKKKKCFNDRSSILMEKNLGEVDKAKQKNYELEVQATDLKDKNQKLKIRISQVQQLLERALLINKSMKVIS